MRLGAESRWWPGKTQSSHLPTARVPAGCWWGNLMPKEMGGTPKWTGRTWGDWGGRRSGSWTGQAPLRGGWEGAVVPTPGGTFWGSDGRKVLNISQLAGEICLVLGPGPTPPEAPSRLCWSSGHRREARGEQERQEGGEPQHGRSERGVEGICPTHLGSGNLLGSPAGSPTLWDQRQVWAPSVPLSLTHTAYTPPGPFPALCVLKTGHTLHSQDLFQLFFSPLFYACGSVLPSSYCFIYIFIFTLFLTYLLVS